MSKLLLAGKKHHYLYDPLNKSTVLKRNGKFGDVYVGVRVADKEIVIIKQLNSSLKDHPLAVSQFRLESDLNIEHEGLRKTFEFIKTGNEYFLVQEYIQGWDLKSFLYSHKHYRNSLPFILSCIIKVLKTLEYLHVKSIVHCDIKPSNILIKEKNKENQDYNDPKIKLIDLGQSKSPELDFVSQTKPFSMIYSPPEQVLHFTDLINPSSDLFALGITTYELITGKNPFNTTHPEMILHMQISGDLMEDKKIPKELFKILLKATAKNKFRLPPNQLNVKEQKCIVEEGMTKRYQSALEMRTDIDNFLETYTPVENFLIKMFK